MSARRATPEARCVFVEVAEMTMSDHDLANTVRSRFKRAPADPVEAAEMAFREWHREGPEKIGSGAVLHLLVALGYPDGSPRQENPT